MGIATAVRIRAYDKSFSKNDFDCGVNALNIYLRQTLSQDIKRKLANGYAALLPDNDVIIGYYTLSAASLPLDALPEERSRRLRYPMIPCALCGRLAVDKRYTGNGLGKVLLYDAIARIRAAEVACCALILDAKDESAKKFYRSFGFESCGNNPMKLFFIL